MKMPERKDYFEVLRFIKGIDKNLQKIYAGNNATSRLSKTLYRDIDDKKYNSLVKKFSSSYEEYLEQFDTMESSFYDLMEYVVEKNKKPVKIK